jgi:hypothetical protein
MLPPPACATQGQDYPASEGSFQKGRLRSNPLSNNKSEEMRWKHVLRLIILQLSNKERESEGEVAQRSKCKNYKIKKERDKNLGVVVHACNPNTGEAEVGES